MDEERIDFSVLDPARDPARLEHMVRAVVAAAGGAPAAAPRAVAFVRFGRAALAVAALLALAAWLPRIAAGPGATSTGDPVETVSTWAERAEVPRNVDVLEVLGGDHVER